MIEDNPTTPPDGFLTPEEEEMIMRLQQDRHDAAREERDLLLAARARAPEDYRLARLSDEFEEITEGMTAREREGFGQLTRDEFVRWGEIQERGFLAVSAQHELYQVAARRIDCAD